MPLLADAEALARDGRAAGRVAPSRGSPISSSAPRRAASSSARRARLQSSAAASWPPGSRASCPGRRWSAKYALEYGFDALELHADAIAEGARVLIHDDVLATGGTAKAKVELVEQLGGDRRRPRRSSSSWRS